MPNDLLIVFAGAIAGASSIVLGVRIGIKIFAPQAFANAARVSPRRHLTVDAAPIEPALRPWLTLPPGQSALSAMHPILESQAGVCYVPEKRQHWTTQTPSPSLLQQ